MQSQLDVSNVNFAPLSSMPYFYNPDSCDLLLESLGPLSASDLGVGAGADFSDGDLSMHDGASQVNAFESTPTFDVPAGSSLGASPPSMNSSISAAAAAAAAVESAVSASWANGASSQTNVHQSQVVVETSSSSTGAVSSGSGESMGGSSAAGAHRIQFGSTEKPWKGELRRKGNNLKPFNTTDEMVHVTVETQHAGLGGDVQHLGDGHVTHIGESITVEVRVERRPHNFSEEEYEQWLAKRQEQPWFHTRSTTFRCSPDSSVQTLPNQRVLKLSLNQAHNKGVFNQSRHPHANRCKEFLFVAVLRINGQVCAQASEPFKVVSRKRNRGPRSSSARSSRPVPAQAVVDMVPELANLARAVLSSEAPRAKRARTAAREQVQEAGLFQPTNDEEEDTDTNISSPSSTTSTAFSDSGYSAPSPFMGAASPPPMPPLMPPVDTDGDAFMHAAYTSIGVDTLHMGADMGLPPAQMAYHVNQMLPRASGMLRALATDLDALPCVQAAMSEEGRLRLSGMANVASSELGSYAPDGAFRGANHDEEEASDATLDMAVVVEFLSVVREFVMRMRGKTKE